AFVFADEATNLDVKVTLRNSFTSGRRKDTRINYDLSGADWQVPLTVKQGQSTLTLSGFGMHPDADASKDKFDDMRLPRFDEYLDVTFEHPEFRFPYFAKDIAPASDEYVWSFVVESTDLTENGLIQWDNSKFGDNDAQLFLLDVETAQMINMREQSSLSYDAAKKRPFKVYFTKGDKEFSPGILLLGNPYPNPARGDVNINLILPDAGKDYGVELVVYDHTGKPVKHLLNSRLPGGAHHLVWDAADYSGDPVASGFYSLRAKVNGRYKGVAQRLLITK
ncbi:MAG: FlgD immunoglobulin-like domain containing protein, partial [Cyclobacteriaceae bacterium]